MDAKNIEAIVREILAGMKGGAAPSAPHPRCQLAD